MVVRAPAVRGPIGVAYGGGHGTGRGCEAAPRALRDRLGASPGAAREVDLLGPFASAADMVGGVRRATARRLDAGAVPVVLGGDHSVALPVVEECQRRRPLAVLWLDAHCDFDDGGAAPLSHKNVLRRIAGLPGVERILVVGHRGFTAWDEGEAAPGRLEVARPRAWRALGGGGAARLLGPSRAWYVSLDIDALDPSLAPGTGFPVPGGLRVEEVFEWLAAVFRRGCLAGFDLVEVDPSRDANGRTLELAATIVEAVVDRLAVA